MHGFNFVDGQSCSKPEMSDIRRNDPATPIRIIEPTSPRNKLLRVRLAVHYISPTNPAFLPLFLRVPRINRLPRNAPVELYFGDNLSEEEEEENERNEGEKKMQGAR